MQSVRDSLAEGGRFVAYQFRDRVHTLGVDVFELVDFFTSFVGYDIAGDEL